MDNVVACWYVCNNNVGILQGDPPCVGDCRLDVGTIEVLDGAWDNIRAKCCAVPEVVEKDGLELLNNLQ